MQRYYTQKETYHTPELTAIQAYLEADARRAVWAKENRGDGLASAADKHSGYAEEPQTLSSVQHIVAQGWL